MTSQAERFNHISVLSRELIDSLNLKQGDLVIDCTTGGGGHSAKILEKILPGGKLLAFDQDQDAIKHLEKKFSKEIEEGSVLLEKTSFSSLETLAEKHGFTGNTASIIADIGVSSHQIDTGERGFSFQQEGPLDMRMDQEETLTAKEVVNTFSQEEIANILWTYGEERGSRRIASRILKKRTEKEITTTKELAEIVANALPYKKSKKNPATKTFQALRIFVNQELEQLKSLLNSSFPALKKGGRLGIITFHSLEDKLVKEKFIDLTGRNKLKDLPREIPLTQEEINRYNLVEGRIIKPFPVKPSDEEMQENPRARSAKLRVIEKV